ncbi:methyltransferase domain-containing protein [Pseudoduganella violacea]|uniref:Class I SAM-dependent methyltransferase n=1 Tax=Pseudoduganella violacea TaxID=1715466 RepID=A0A7W5B6N1_9BURK|nr:methyltransferase domain-containing protein [Pseudoduganella violacea]MBB3117524.1 hypothetical protein [Pseudoduganella violacea]
MSDQVPSHIAPLFALLPPNARQLLEFGHNGGALAQRYKQSYPATFYQGLAATAQEAGAARAHYDMVHQANLDHVGPAFYSYFAQADCWIFDGTLESLRDPWRVLANIRKVIAADCSVVVHVRNSQHWMTQLALNRGAMLYGEQGTLSKHQQRLYTRASLMTLFAECGFQVVGGRTLDDAQPPSAAVSAALHQMAQLLGADPAHTLADALPSHFLIKAVPV